ncbi:hypothetical protein KUCAC02_004952 [Chaenocephalus aceratus]|uniref:Uncharacterized protein n=1 Tax=Chaenocephalus aceratus TaxID=36190 RepID=A0ACB9X1T6_CHAAC|nr:hypothetical protein KUCAC02_004952 [Chaenocephalus aceratus]
MMSVQTPPLSRSGSSPSNVGMANRSGPSSAPPTSLSLRSSYNQLLGRDVIKESMETGKGGGPTKSSSSSALYSSSSSMFNTTNPKLAKNGANMQRRAESQQQELSRANTEEKIHNDLLNNPSSDWLESGKDNAQLPPFRRRTKSFLDYHGKGWDLDHSWGNKEDNEEEKKEQPSPENKQQPSPEKEQASPAKERESQKEEKPGSKPPLLPVLLEAPLSPTSSSSNDSPEWVPDNQNLLQSRAPAQVREELCAQVQVSPCSPAKPPRSYQPRVIKVELHPNNENQFLQQYPPSSPKQARAAERSTPTRTRAPPALTDPQAETVLPKQMHGARGTCPQAGGRSQTHQRSISGTSPPAPRSTTDLLPPATSRPLLAMSQTLSTAPHRKSTTPRSPPTSAPAV